ncbi:MAG TPA: hypothetical protein VMB50_23530 [Myxococcales bacterium]|nr:hypothetical protein [Myxococcales bacterium]
MSSSALDVSAVPRAAAEPRAATPFIVGPWFDGAFFFASVLTVFAAWIASASFGVSGFYVLAAVAIASNGPHLASTWTRVYMDRREWKKRPVQIFLVPLAILGAIVGLTFWGARGFALENTVLLYWATWHFLQQNWGLLRIYQRRSGEPDSALALRLERPLLYLSVAWCALHRLKTGPRTLFGTEVAYPDLPWPVIHALLGVVVCLALVYLVLRVREARASAWIRVGFLLCAFLGFAVPFLLIKTDGTTAFAAAACWHGLQYIGIVRFYHRNAWTKGVAPYARVVSWLSQPGWGRVFLYSCLLWALAGSGYVLIYGGSLLTRGTSWTIETWGGVTWLSLTFSHYYLDGVIWKLRRDKQVAQSLLLDAPPT